MWMQRDKMHRCKHLAVEQRQRVVSHSQRRQVETPSGIRPAIKGRALFVGHRMIAGGANQVRDHTYLGQSEQIAAVRCVCCQVPCVLHQCLLSAVWVNGGIAALPFTRSVHMT